MVTTMPTLLNWKRDGNIIKKVLHGGLTIKRKNEK
jgi:hypothetical protein